MRFRPAGGTSAPNVGKKNATPNKRTLLLMDETLKSQDGFFITSKPLPKRKKPQMEVRYPENIPVPDIPLVQALYEMSANKDGSHQASLDSSGSGLLSLEEVVLPAVAREEMNAIKKIQAQAQRDARDAVPAIKQCRKIIYESIHRAMVTTKEAREFREMKEQEIEKNLAEQKRAAKEEARRQRREEKIQRREMRAKALAEKKIEAKCEMKKKFPKNMENWREVAFLMTELARIKKEEKLWNEASLYLDEQEKEVLALEEQAGAHFNGDDTEVIDVSTDAKIYDERLSQAVESLVLSTRRIGRAIDTVKVSIDQSENDRKDLYQKYRNDHMFYGYKGVKNPKSLLIALSQEG